MQTKKPILAYSNPEPLISLKAEVTKVRKEGKVTSFLIHRPRTLKNQILEDEQIFQLITSKEDSKIKSIEICAPLYW